MTISDAFVLLIIFGTAFIILFIAWICISNNDIDNESENVNDNGLSSTNRMIAYLRLQLSLVECIELYNKIFDSNENQLTLESKHIVTKMLKSPTTNNNDVTEEIGEKLNTTIESSSFVDVELGGSDGNGTEDGNKDNDNDSDDVCGTTKTTILRLDHNKDKQRMEIKGTCIICFEDFVKDDVIVWSENLLCSHIYHKECMVHYLASNAQRNSEQQMLLSISTPAPTPTTIINVTNNPCPTCRRQNYCCIICSEDILHIVKNRVIKTTTPIYIQ